MPSVRGWREGWWREARAIASPNFGPRPAGTVITLVVLHSISLPPGEYGGPHIEQLFTNTLDWSAHPYFEGIRGLQVSAHFVVGRDGRVQMPLQVRWNGERFGEPHGGEMNFHFGQLIAHAARTRRLTAGSIVGSGTVSNRATEVKGKKEWTKGYSCIAEKRAIETIQDGQPSTDYMKFGDTIRIEMKGRDGQSVFGAIDQKIVALTPSASA